MLSRTRSGLVFPLCRSEKIATGLLTATTRLSADLAMSVGIRMPLALAAAERADRHARLQQRLDDARVIRRRAAREPSGGRADICAIQTQPYARDHRGHALIGQVSVGIGGASRRTVV